MEDLVAEDLDPAVVRLERIIEDEFVVRARDGSPRARALSLSLCAKAISSSITCAASIDRLW